MVLRNWLEKLSSGLALSSRHERNRRTHLHSSPESYELRILPVAVISPADLSLIQSVNAPNPGLGSTVTFTVTLRNDGPSSASGISVADAAPVGLSGVTFTPSVGSYSAGVWSIPSLSSGNTGTLTVTGTVTPSILANGTILISAANITNNAEVTASNQSDPDSTPNNHNPVEDDQTSLTQHINDAPSLTVSGASFLNPISVNQPSGLNPGTLVSDIIARMTPGGITDPDAGALKGIAINGASNPDGAWEYTLDGGTHWLPVGAGVSNDGARLLASNANTRVRFLPNAGFRGTARFSYVAWDQTAGSNGGLGVTKFRTDVSPFSAGFDYSTINITNTAPVLTNPGNPAFSISVNLPSVNNHGTPIEAVIAAMSPGGITDVDAGAVQGIAINGLSGNANGTWEYTVNNGTNWSPIGTTGNSDARLLAADGNTRIRFVPNLNFQGEAKFSFVAWDRTAGSNGGVTNVSSRGLSTPYSLAFEVASLFVTRSDLQLSQTVSAPNPGLGSTVTFTVTLTNNGPGSALNIGVANAAPVGLSGVTFLPSSGTYSAGVWSLPSLGAGQSATLTVAGVVTPNILPNGTVLVSAKDITNNAEVIANDIVDVDSTPNNGNPVEDDQTTLTRHINVAPVLDNSGNPALDNISVYEPEALNAGTGIDAIISRMGPTGGITDVDSGALQGIAVNGAANANGRWQYSTNNGANWKNVGNPDNNSARLLAADGNTRIRFLPNPGFKGTSQISFVAWDRTAGTNGGTGVTKFRTDVSPFSSAIEFASIAVTNAAPVLTASNSAFLNSISNTISDAANAGTLVSDLITRMGPSGSIADADPGAVKGIAINGLSQVANGQWQYSTNGGLNWNDIHTTGNGNAQLLASNSSTRIRFVPDSGFVGVAKIAFVAWDQTSGVNGGVAAVGSRGGDKAFSLGFDYASLTVT